MFEIESRWISEKINSFEVEQVTPILNIGSSSLEYNVKHQPWVINDLFAPLVGRGIEVFNLDFRQGQGIDLVGDILDDDFFATLRGRSFRLVMCCNMLEHVTDPAELARRCLALVESSGLLLITVPYEYPRHGDPIDNLYRPTPAQLLELFPGTECRAGDIVDVKKSYRDHVRARPWIILRHVFRFPFPFLNFSKWKHSMKKLKWLFSNYKVTAVVLRRTY